MLYVVPTFVFTRRQFLWVQVGTKECGGLLLTDDQLISLDPVFKPLTQTLL